MLEQSSCTQLDRSDLDTIKANVYVNTVYLSDLEIIAFGYFGPVALTVGLVLIYFYISRKALRKPPGMLILWQCVAQTCMDANWTATGINYYYMGRSRSDSILCASIGLTAVYMETLSCCYNLCVSFEILRLLRMPFPSASGIRNFLYHLIAHMVSLALCIFAAVTGSIADTLDGFCFFSTTNFTGAMWIPAVYGMFMLSYLVISVTLLVLLIKTLGTIYRHKQRRIVRRYLIFLIASIVLYTGFPGHFVAFLIYYITTVASVQESTLHHEFDMWSQIIKTAIILGSITGIIIASIRIAEVHPRFAERSSSKDTEIPTIYNTLTEDLMTECILFTLFSLHMLFKSRSTLSDTVSVNSSAHHKQYEIKVVPEDVYLLGADSAIFESSTKFLEGKVREIEAETFFDLRILNSTSDYDLEQSLSPINNFESLAAHSGNKGGKSGAFIYATYDHKFILKTITRSELKQLLKMVSSLSSHLHNYMGSYLSRILGIFKVERTGKSSFNVMLIECLIPPITELTCTFDMKGSVDGRRRLKDPFIVSIDKIPNGIVCKDLDFLQTQRRLQIDPSDYRVLMQTLERDVEYLRSQKVMDYSMLVGITDDPNLLKPYSKYFIKASRGLYCCFGIIDFLQSYNYRKRLETFGLVIRKRNQPSSVKPSLYSRRFLDFLNKVVVPLTGTQC